MAPRPGAAARRPRDGQVGGGCHDTACPSGRCAAWCRVTIIDAGPTFDPTAAAAPDVGAPLEARPIGGLGLHLVRQSVDALRYARVAGHNVVTMERWGGGAPVPRTR